MSFPNQGAGGSVSTGTLLDYLRPEINRPDLYEQQSFIVKDIRGPSASTLQRKEATPASSASKDSTIAYTVGIILLSAVIFITLVSWSDCLRSWLDSIYISPVIQPQVRSRIIYAVIITIISLVVIGLLFWAYLRLRK